MFKVWVRELLKLQSVRFQCECRGAWFLSREFFCSNGALVPGIFLNWRNLFALKLLNVGVDGAADADAVVGVFNKVLHKDFCGEALSF